MSKNSIQFYKILVIN